MDVYGGRFKGEDTFLSSASFLMECSAFANIALFPEYYDYYYCCWLAMLAVLCLAAIANVLYPGVDTDN